SFILLLQVFFFYGLWLTLVSSISIFYNTFLNTPGLVAALTIITIISMSIVSNIFGHLLTWSPIYLSTYIHDMLIFNQISTVLIVTSLITIALICIFVIGSIFNMRKK